VYEHDHEYEYVYDGPCTSTITSTFTRAFGADQDIVHTWTPTADDVERYKLVLSRVVAMLTRMCR
jgi:hypothetical protein